MARAPQSNGTLGEQMAEVWFRAHGWEMERHQPPTKVIWAKGKPVVIHCKKGGISDFTGYRKGLLNAYVACECKEAHGKTWACSKLDKDQREWMGRRPPGCAYVAITWTDRDGPWCEIHPFKPKGSYRRGEGAR
jgi:hypothetical protein